MPERERALLLSRSSAQRPLGLGATASIGEIFLDRSPSARGANDDTDAANAPSLRSRRASARFRWWATSPPFRYVERHQSGTGEPENLRVREKPQGETADARGVACREVRPWHQQSQ